MAEWKQRKQEANEKIRQEGDNQRRNQEADEDSLDNLLYARFDHSEPRVL